MKGVLTMAAEKYASLMNIAVLMPLASRFAIRTSARAALQKSHE